MSLIGAAILFAASAARALPTAPTIVCDSYPDAPDCAGRVVACSFCHDTIDPPSWNAFGTLVKSKLASGASFDSELPRVLAALEQEDPDGDGLTNAEELARGSAPGRTETGPKPGTGVVSGKNPLYRVDGYDFAFAFRRLSALYCGRSPSYDEQQLYKDPTASDEQLKAQLHDSLANCLQSEYWRKQVLPRLADKRIRPLVAAGPDSQIQIAGYRLVIGDYNYDYRLWEYALTDDRDMRDLLIADYFVQTDATGKLVQNREIIVKSDEKALAGNQPLSRERRAGMITTQWFLTINTMFSALPRTSAAQAYRAYLGADISSSEGLRPVAGEPSDVDQKGVAAERCAVCHSTLDPLSYAFAKYEGIQNSIDLRFGDYRPERTTEMIPAWSDAKQQSVVLGKPVKDLVEWAHVAAESDEFKRTMAEMLFEHALGEKPQPADQAEFGALWRSCVEDGYSANRLLHRLIDTLSFGAP